MNNKIFYLGLILTIGLSSCSESSKEEISETEPSSGSSKIGLINDKRILSAESEPGNWLAFGRDYEEQRFSPLKKINSTLLHCL